MIYKAIIIISYVIITSQIYKDAVIDDSNHESRCFFKASRAQHRQRWLKSIESMTGTSASKNALLKRGLEKSVPMLLDAASSLVFSLSLHLKKKSRANFFRVPLGGSTAWKPAMKPGDNDIIACIWVK